ncbi:hypothetical protein [Paracoccus sediminilitoris]|uniref:hypothetical protein n=1 Tax=Paracoccus sediminilitoris TaxID=2202419 RepID=UPI001313F5DE|nr:hypothetical protein [Paracoccus sediminilitoris]
MTEQDKANAVIMQDDRTADILTSTASDHPSQVRQVLTHWILFIGGLTVLLGLAAYLT